MATVGLQFCDVVDCLPQKKDSLGNRQECVLLIEDNEDAMLLVRYALQEYGNGTYRLEWADGLKAGLQRLSKGGIDLVILDLGLPDSSGPDSYAAVRKAVPELPVLVLTGDTRECVEFNVAAQGVEDFLLKDEVSGELLVQAIRSAMYSNRRWCEQKNSAHKLNPRFVWANEKCQALSALGTRMLEMNRIESAIGCMKASIAIVNNYSESDGATMAGRAELFVGMERMARVASARGLKETERRFRAAIAAPIKAETSVRAEFEAAMRKRIERIDLGPEESERDATVAAAGDLAQVLRQILESVPKMSDNG